MNCFSYWQEEHELKDPREAIVICRTRFFVPTPDEVVLEIRREPKSSVCMLARSPHGRLM